MSQSKSSAISDKVGITSAVLCTIHCMVIPTLFLLKAWYGDMFAAGRLPPWWACVDILFLVISFTAVYHSAGHTNVWKIKAALWVSWTVLAIAIIWENQLHWLAYFASAGLITTHIINIRRMSKSLLKGKQKSTLT
jgi:hypothetical protein